MIKVLIIEDDAWLGESYRTVLKQAGCDVVVVSDAESAMQSIDSTQPDVIVADVVLRGQTVFGLLHELQTYDDTKIIPVILCTGLETRVIRPDKLHSYGVVKVLSKSTLSPAELSLAVKEYGS